MNVFFQSSSKIALCSDRIYWGKTIGSLMSKCQENMTPEDAENMFKSFFESHK